MRARAETLGGMASIGPRADHDGTEVRLEIPLVLAEATP